MCPLTADMNILQVEEKRAVSQDLELWISKEVVKDGYNLVVRTGRLVQEIHVTTDLPSVGMKESGMALFDHEVTKKKPIHEIG